eukprot:9790352-Alexandrium_andersonii.AAC.1
MCIRDRPQSGGLHTVATVSVDPPSAPTRGRPLEPRPDCTSAAPADLRASDAPVAGHAAEPAVGVSAAPASAAQPAPAQQQPS